MKRTQMQQARLQTWLIAVLLVMLLAPPPGLICKLLTPVQTEAPTGGKQPPQLRGRNRIGDLPVACCVTHQAPRCDSRRRTRQNLVRRLTVRTTPLLGIIPSCSTSSSRIHLRC